MHVLQMSTFEIKLTNNGRPDDGSHTLEEQKESERVCKLLRTKEVSQHQRGEENIGGTKCEIYILLFLDTMKQ